MAKFKVTRKQVPHSGGLKTSYTATLVKNREVSAEEFSEVLTKRTRVNPIAAEIKFIFPALKGVNLISSIPFVKFPADSL